MSDNTTMLAIGIQAVKGGLLTKQEYTTIVGMYVFVLYPVVTFAGIVTNIINVKTFVILGLHDGVSVSLFSLALSDLCWCVSIFITGMSSVFTEIEIMHQIRSFPINPMAVTIFGANVGQTFYAMTTMTTTFLAVARCMCVVKPLRFKFVFTRSRSIIVHTIFALFAIAWYTALFSQMGTRERFDPSVNSTRIMLWFSEYREEVKDVVFLFYHTAFTFANQILIFVCVLVMADSLKKSSKFRQESKALTTDGNNETDNKLSGKELQVVKQVILISTIYMLCSFPKMGSSLYNLTDPDFSLMGRLGDLYLVLYYTSIIFETINSTSTFFIYYNYNSKFRSTFRKLKNVNNGLL